MSIETVFRNARIVGAEDIIEGSLQVRAGGIASIASGGCSLPQAMDFEGDYLLPGLVELHTDNFERHLMPRPKVRWPDLPALIAHDAEIAAAGITTVYDALGVGDTDEDALRGQSMGSILAVIEQAARDGLLRAEHRLHARCELPAANARRLFEPFENHPLLGLLSLMDHTPGQRQWTDIDQARIYYTGKKGWSDEKFLSSIARGKEMQTLHAEPHRRYFLDVARRRGLPLASHDDTTPEHVAEAKAQGMAISEFPTRAEAARAAREQGLAIVMGAPNVVRGGSHSGNIAAIDLAADDLLDALSSDYVPSSLLPAAFMLLRDAGWTLPRAIATVSKNPARAAGLDDRGEITPGRRADLIRVRVVNGQPVVRSVWRGGDRVS